MLKPIQALGDVASVVATVALVLVTISDVAKPGHGKFLIEPSMALKVIQGLPKIAATIDGAYASEDTFRYVPRETTPLTKTVEFADNEK